MLRILLTLATLFGGDGLPLKPPVAVGMSSERLEAIDRVMRRGLEGGGFAGAAVVVGRRGAVVWQRGYGRLDWSPRSEAVDAARTLYDLASLTKVVATTAAIMVLHDRGQLRIDDPVSKYLPAFSGGAKSRVTIRQLLEHRSGLPAGRDVWRTARSPNQARRQLIATPLFCAPGERELYSDVGADILGFIVESVSGEPLDLYVRRQLLQPLGMTSTTYRPAASLRRRIAPTETAPPRGRPLRGEVHDENAYALGGVAGHAGLFGTAADLAIFAQMLLNGGAYNGVRVVHDSTVALFTRRSSGWRALGFETCAGGASCGQHMSERAFGHTGYTGTSLWIDPDRAMFVIVLTNWAHPRPDGHTPPLAILQDVRADVADIAELSTLDDATGPPPMPTLLRADRGIGWDY
jgi:CubicO group peptidase (beta-lactamase class C family)